MIFGGFGMFGVPSFIVYLPLIIYLTEASSTSLITLLPWIGIALIVAGITCIIMGGRAAEKAGVTVWGRQPVVKETIKEREIVYIRCKYCGAKYQKRKQSAQNAELNYNQTIQAKSKFSDSHFKYEPQRDQLLILKNIF